MKRLITILFSIMSCLTWAQTSTVTLTSEKQYIRGFGGINLPEWQGSDLTTAQRNTAFGNSNGQIGMSVLRIYVSDNTNDWSKALATAKVAISMGLTVFATPWNPPASMCETVTRNNRQEKRLKYASYSDYAQHLIDFNNYMKNNGVNLYAMSFANEPDWGFDWTWYSIDEVYNFVTSQAAKLRVNGVKVITAESFSYSKQYYDKILNDPAALANIDIIGCHLYGSDATSPNSFFQYPLADQLATGKERWVTEHYTDSNNDADLWPMAHDVSYEIYRSMVEGQMSVYTWWYIRRSYGPIKEDGTVSKRGYCMSQYSKFIRPGYVRVDATKNPTTDIYVSAYKKGDDVVIVVVNRGTSTKTITLSIPGTKVNTWDEYVTSGSKNVAKETSINSTTGSFQITLDAQSTTTFVGIAPIGTPTANITAAGPVSFCAGGSVVLNATTGTGYTYQWKKDGSNITNATSSSYTATQSGSYTVTISANSQTATSTAVVVTVNALPSAPTVTSPVTYCQNATAATITATGTSLKWYTVSTGGTASTTSPTPSTTTAGTTSFYVSQTKNGCEGPRVTIAVTVNSLPTAPTVTSPVTYCQNATATALTATGTSLKWYTVATGGTASTTAPTQSTVTAGTTNYYVSQTTNACEGPRATMAITVNANPIATIIPSGPTTFCQGSGNVTLNANTGTGLSYVWRNGANQVGSNSASQAIYITSGSYSVEITDAKGCKATSAPIAVTVNTPPAAPAVSDVSYCQNATATALTATGTSLKWYTVSIGGVASTTAPIPITTTAGTTSYYVSQTINTCEGPRATIAVAVNALSSAPTVTSSVTYCQNSTATTLAATGTGLKWYTVATGGTASMTAPMPTTATAGTTNYYVSQTMNGCEGPRATIAVTVNALPTTPTVTSPVTYCQNATAIALTATGTSLKWYTVATGGTALTTAPTPVTTTAGTTNFYVSQTTNTCEGSRATIAVTVNALPSAATVTSPVTYCQNATAKTLTATGTSLKWYTVATGGTASTSAPTPSTATTGTINYYVSQTTKTCEGSRVVINVQVNELPLATITPDGPTTFSEGGSVTFIANTGAGLTYEWFNGSTPLGTNATYTATTSGNYEVEVTNEFGCKSTSPTTIVTVNSNQPSEIVILSPTTNTTMTSPITISINATDPDGDIVLVEYLDGTTVIGTSTILPYSFIWGNPSAGSHAITVRVTDSNGGITTSSPLTVTTGITSVWKPWDEANINIYPNPTKGELYIESNLDLSDASIQLQDMLGSELEVSWVYMGKQAKVDFSSLAEGTYLLFIKEDDHVIVKKISVSK